MISQEQILLYMDLFRGRKDIYARHWEKNGKSGYVDYNFIKSCQSIIFNPLAILQSTFKLGFAFPSLISVKYKRSIIQSTNSNCFGHIPLIE